MTRALTSKEKMDRLRAALRDDVQPTSAALANRLDRCAVDWNGRFECRSPACWHCRRRYIARESRVTRQNFGHLTNENLGLMSVVVGATSEVAGIGALIRHSRDNTRKRVAACRQEREAWNGVYLQGWHEVDAVAAHHVPMLPPRRRALIEQIAPLSFDSPNPAWIATWHGIVHLNEMSVDNIACQFRRQWPLAGQVDVRPFDVALPVSANLDRVTSYASKFECSIKLVDHQVDQWPIRWQSDFFAWLQGLQRNPFEALRFSVNPRVADVEDVNVEVMTEPMPTLISRVSMYDSTGPVS